jgi:hypothetical protein
MAKTARTGNEKVEDPKTIFERFKENVALIAGVPKNAGNGNATKKPRKPA